MIIAIGTAASGLDIFLRFNGVLTDPTAISYEITEPGSTVVGSDVGFKRSVGHYDARNSIIPSGYDTTSPWLITWQFTSPAGVTSTASENFTVADTLVPSFSNIDNLVEQIKLDLALTDEFTQTQYETFVSKALNRLNRRLRFTGTTSQLSIDQTTGTITPVPDASIFDLILLQTECLIVKRGRKEAVGRGIRVRDGETEIDTTARFAGDNEVVKDVCGELDDAIEDYLSSGIDAASEYGEVVWYGNTRITATMDHDGTGSYRTRGFASTYETPHLVVDMQR